MDVKDLILKKVEYAVAGVIRTWMMGSTEVAMYLKMFIV